MCQPYIESATTLSDTDTDTHIFLLKSVRVDYFIKCHLLPARKG